MARRYRRRPKVSKQGTQIIQIVGLTLVLVMVLLFRDEIAGGAGQLFGNMGSEDLALPEEGTAPDDGPPSPPPTDTEPVAPATSP